jgi:hypothetical protein
MADTIKLDIPTSVAERIARTSALQILQWFKDGSLNNEQAVAAFIDWRDCTHPPAPAVGAEDVARALKTLQGGRTSYNGYAITKQDQYPDVLASFWKELQRVDKAVRDALSLLSGQGGGK